MASLEIKLKKVNKVYHEGVSVILNSLSAFTLA